MSEEGELPTDRPVENDALLYDWFKYLTTMSLLTLGGVLTLSQSPDGADIKAPVLAAVLVVVAIAGVLAFSGADQIVRAKLANQPLPRQVHRLQRAAPLTLAMGVGGFLYLFARAMA